MRVIVGVAVATLAGCNLLFTAEATPDAAPMRDAEQPLGCPASYDVVLSGSRYRAATNAVSWMQAQNDCAKDGATNGSTHLAVIDDMEELNALHAIGALSGSNTWIGLTDIRTEGLFRAIVVSPPDFPGATIARPPWTSGQPDDVNGNQDCAIMQSNGSAVGLLQDDDCTAPHTYVCECDRNVVDVGAFPP